MVPDCEARLEAGAEELELRLVSDCGSLRGAAIARSPAPTTSLSVAGGVLGSRRSCAISRALAACSLGVVPQESVASGETPGDADLSAKASGLVAEIRAALSGAE